MPGVHVAQAQLVVEMAAPWKGDGGVVAKDLQLPVGPCLQIVDPTLGFQQRHEPVGEHVRVHIDDWHFGATLDPGISRE